MTERSDILSRYTSLASALRILRTSAHTLLPPETWDDGNDRLMMATYKNAKKLKSLVALCFTEAGETYHHWKVFAGGSDGVCIRFDRQRLEQAFRDADVDLKPIDYRLIEQNRLNRPPLDELPFCKRSAFRAEAEVRAVLGSRTLSFEVRDVPFPRGAVDKVLVNPWLHPGLFTAVQETINAIPGFADLEVMQSRLLDSPAWAKLAASYAVDAPAVER
jgi:hypothetical protein